MYRDRDEPLGLSYLLPLFDYIPDLNKGLRRGPYMLRKGDCHLLRDRKRNNSLCVGELLSVRGMYPSSKPFSFNQLHYFIISSVTFEVKENCIQYTISIKLLPLKLGLCLTPSCLR